jgi:hypothetical protein
VDGKSVTRRPTTRREPRLSEPDVLLIARNAALASPEASWDDVPLLVTKLTRENCLVHVVSPAVFGASFVVEVDDESGTVISAGHIGIR